MADSQLSAKVEPPNTEAISAEPRLQTDGPALLEEKNGSTAIAASESNKEGKAHVPHVLVPHPCFPALPEYKPPTVLRNIGWGITRFISAVISSTILGVIVTLSVTKLCFVSLGETLLGLLGRHPDKKRPFWEVEQKNKRERKEQTKAWEDKKKRTEAESGGGREEQSTGTGVAYEPTEGGKDRLIRDIGYYARRVGLDGEMFKVQTEDGFLLDLWHIYNPKEYTPLPEKDRKPIPYAELLSKSRSPPTAAGDRKYPVLLIPGILQTSGVYCSNDDDSFAFYLAKSGYDVWLGTNRCGYKPENTNITPSSPRHWSWTVQHMGNFDLPALIQRVLYETSFEKLGLVGHSQGTAQTFIALSKNQRPAIAEKISVFCALAPAAYAGSLADIITFRLIRMLPPVIFRFLFGIHAFIPTMMVVANILPPWLYSNLAWLFISFLFNWSDRLIDRTLRQRGFLFSPLYISAENLNWWVGRGGFTGEKCILNSREVSEEEELEDVRKTPKDPRVVEEKAWFDARAPPMAFWVGGSDYLCDGMRLLRRLESGREPHLRVAHTRVIEEYDHVDVIWAVDAVEKVGREVRDVIWKSVDEGVRGGCREVRIDG
ncbi:hypothetical protein FQN50_005791 [Emmonsiellopsis sp. PD_5]|nr:hypothetical protein FQN50_005791 [Emmonsiellopsis sp. PD_5]